MAASDLAEYITDRAKVLGLSKTTLAKQAKISRSALYKFLDGDVYEIRLSTVVQLAQALKTHPLDLLRHLFPRWEFPTQASSSAKYSKDASGFVADITYPDHSIVSVSQEFEKIWEIRNLGEQVWENRRLVCCDAMIQISASSTPDPEMTLPRPQRGLLPLQREVPIRLTRPGESVQVAVRLCAPDYPGTIISYWKMVDAQGKLCFPELEGLSCLVNIVAI